MSSTELRKKLYKNSAEERNFAKKWHLCHSSSYNKNRILYYNINLVGKYTCNFPVTLEVHETNSV